MPKSDCGEYAQLTEDIAYARNVLNRMESMHAVLRKCVTKGVLRKAFQRIPSGVRAQERFRTIVNLAVAQLSAETLDYLSFLTASALRKEYPELLEQVEAEIEWERKRKPQC